MTSHCRKQMLVTKLLLRLVWTIKIQISKQSLPIRLGHKKFSF